MILIEGVEVIQNDELESRARLIIQVAARIAHMMMAGEDFGPYLLEMQKAHNFAPSYLPMYAEMYMHGWRHAMEQENES